MCQYHQHGRQIWKYFSALHYIVQFWCWCKWFLKWHEILAWDLHAHFTDWRLYCRTQYSVSCPRWHHYCISPTVSMLQHLCQTSTWLFFHRKDELSEILWVYTETKENDENKSDFTSNICQTPVIYSYPPPTLSSFLFFVSFKSQISARLNNFHSLLYPSHKEIWGSWFLREDSFWDV